MATYTSPPDLVELERDAWRRGDREQSAMLGRLADAEEQLAALDNEGFTDAADAIQCCHTAEQKLANAREALAEFRTMLDDFARLTHREAIESALRKVSDAVGD